MRFRLLLAKSSKCIIPINYQYELSAWVYKKIKEADHQYADFLHREGYSKKHKHFKFFTFSNLYIRDFQVLKDRLKINNPSISFDISFLVPRGAENFIKGVFQNQQLRLGDAITQGNFEVIQIEAKRINAIDGTARLKASSPVVVSKPKEKNGKLIPNYLAPENKDYKDLFFKNLINKYQAAQAHGLVSGLNGLSESDMDLKVLSKPRSRLVTIKAFTPQETRVKGYLYDFELTTPKPLIEIGLQAGFGEKNSLGFGFGEVVSGKIVNGKD